MWIRKMPAEAALEKQARFARSLGFDLAMGLMTWYVLVSLCTLLNLPIGSPSLYVALGLVALIAPASWWEFRTASRHRDSTMVCERCNALKSADGQRTCHCGGTYYNLPEMKWIAPVVPVRLRRSRPV